MVLLIFGGCRSTSSINSYGNDGPCVTNESESLMACLSEEKESVYQKLEVIDVVTKQVTFSRSFLVDEVIWNNDSILKVYLYPEMVEKDSEPIVFYNVRTGKEVKETKSKR